MCCFCCTSKPSDLFSDKEPLLFIYGFINFLDSLKMSEINCKSYTLTYTVYFGHAERKLQTLFPLFLVKIKNRKNRKICIALDV